MPGTVAVSTESRDLPNPIVYRHRWKGRRAIDRSSWSTPISHVGGEGQQGGTWNKRRRTAERVKRVRHGRLWIRSAAALEAGELPVPQALLRRPTSHGGDERPGKSSRGSSRPAVSSWWYTASASPLWRGGRDRGDLWQGQFRRNEREGQDPPCAPAAPAASTGTAAVPDASGEPGEPSRAECERVEGEFVGRRALLLPACYRRGGRATSTATDGSTNGSGSAV